MLDFQSTVIFMIVDFFCALGLNIYIPPLGIEGVAMNESKIKKNILHRAKIAEGHFKKVIKMIENDEYCLDILNQSSAVQSALKKIDEKILEDHLNTCVAHKINKGQGREATKEVMEVFKRR
jgi:CsoR family transcriptional regulator, copper-sensing transcriptional repressor